MYTISDIHFSFFACFLAPSLISSSFLSFWDKLTLFSLCRFLLVLLIRLVPRPDKERNTHHVMFVLTTSLIAWKRGNVRDLVPDKRVRGSIHVCNLHQFSQSSQAKQRKVSKWIVC